MECFEYLINPHMKMMELIEVFSSTNFFRVQFTDSFTWSRNTTGQTGKSATVLPEASFLIKRDTVESVLYKHQVLQMQPLKHKASAESSQGSRDNGVSLFSVQELFQIQKASEKQQLMQKNTPYRAPRPEIQQHQSPNIQTAKQQTIDCLPDEGLVQKRCRNKISLCVCAPFIRQRLYCI